VGASSREREGRGAADPGPATRHDRDLVEQLTLLCDPLSILKWRGDGEVAWRHR